MVVAIESACGVNRVSHMTVCNGESVMPFFFSSSLPLKN